MKLIFLLNKLHEKKIGVMMLKFSFASEQITF